MIERLESPASWEQLVRSLVRRSVVSHALRVIRRIARANVLRRSLKAVLTVWIVVTATFFLVRLMPGSPVEVYIHTLISQYGFTYDEAANQAAALFAFDPDQPLVLQYLDYMRSLVRGDLG
ncbi:hypothetical protein OO015_11350 [Thermomicrobium sp. 4228-Ro]|uniref:hypothetical protein n=1 Tax=Thermomicrobium sp. 4228-Ro TaxID=2993937 RepID=UPI002248F0BD|nr:hypothetical protein [Thermomicrobium sp. 4228-Ro]MCX2728086.1 hypothetical protein [Thermomicrobium sp. 4228-Ro]